MSIVTLTINDKLVSAPANATLLDTIQEQGIDVPTLCHLKGLSERGGCRLCVVEMVGSPRLFASCVTPVAEGMVVLHPYRKVAQISADDDRTAPGRT